MRWDFDDDNVPVPGREMVGYVRLSLIRPPGAGAEGALACHVEVHQLVGTPEQAAFMEVAWRMVLGRLKGGGGGRRRPDARPAEAPEAASRTSPVKGRDRRLSTGRTVTNPRSSYSARSTWCTNRLS